MSERTKDLKSLTAKIELSAEIARIALQCPSCKGHIVKAVENYKFRNSQGKKVDNDIGAGAAEGGHSSLLESATNEQDGLTNIVNRQQYK